MPAHSPLSRWLQVGKHLSFDFLAAVMHALLADAAHADCHMMAGSFFCTLSVTDVSSGKSLQPFSWPESQGRARKHKQTHKVASTCLCLLFFGPALALRLTIGSSKPSLNLRHYKGIMATPLTPPDKTACPLNVARAACSTTSSHVQGTKAPALIPSSQACTCPHVLLVSRNPSMIHGVS